ncbi:hypothetical protein D3C81_1894200 [compost metagenome]
MEDRRDGKDWETTKFIAQSAILAIAVATPRIRLGNISASSTHTTAPRDTAKAAT